MRIFRFIFLTVSLTLPPALGWAQAQDAKPVSERKIVFRVAPPYPVQAKLHHLNGRVRLEVSVGSDGRVRSEQVIGGNPILVDAALRAVKQWKWEPSPKPSSELVEISFEGAE